MKAPYLTANDGRFPCSECGAPFWKIGRALTCGPKCSCERTARLAREKRAESSSAEGIDLSRNNASALVLAPDGWRCPCCRDLPAPGRWFCSDRCLNAFKDAVVARMAESLWGLA